MTIAAAKKKTIHYGILWTLLALILSLQVSYGTAFPEVQAAFEIDDVDAYDGSLRPRFLFNLSEEQLKLNRMHRAQPCVSATHFSVCK